MRKYVVVKAAELRWRDHPTADGDAEWPRTATITEDMVLDDAEVIRRKDAFAAPALWAYANSIGIVASELRAAGVPELRPQANRLQSIADHFAQAAEAAAHANSRLPD